MTAPNRMLAQMQPRGNLLPPYMLRRHLFYWNGQTADQCSNFAKALAVPVLHQHCKFLNTLVVAEKRHRGADRGFGL